ncbi:MAG: ABC transporter ATP-binding protein, partial [Candidatus Omnitrophica bacterium]|nr:ABC transporter ATP-binding protein [Candidatus Omnitrophota bacterium]
AIVEEAPTPDILHRPQHPYTRWLLHCASLDLDVPPSSLEGE